MSRAPRLFLALLALMSLYAVFLVADRRVPPGGSVFEPGGLLQPVLAASRLRSIAGFMLEELILLVGMWRLASRYFPSPETRFFVSVAAVGSSLWVDPGAPNLRLVAALPLLMDLLHEGLEGPSRAPLFLAGSLTVLQAMGKTPGVALMTPLAALASLAGAALFLQSPLSCRLREGARNPSFWIGTSVALCLAVVVARFTGVSGGGAPGGSPGRILDLALGVSPSPGVASFCGFLTLACAGLALTLIDARRSMLLLVAILVGAAFPTLPLSRLIVILLSGCGFQALLYQRFHRTAALRAVATSLAILSLGLAAMAELALLDPASMLGVSEVLGLRPASQASLPELQRVALDSDLPGISALMAALASGVLFLWNSGRRHMPIAVGLILLLQALDVFGWKFRMTWLRTAPMLPGLASAGSPSMSTAWAVGCASLSIFWILCVLRMAAEALRSARL